MKSKEIFALALRIIGILGLAFVVRHLVDDLSVDGHQLPTVYFVRKIIYLLIGLYFVWGAPQLVKFAYSSEPKA
jgi:hypothetical protein